MKLIKHNRRLRVNGASWTTHKKVLSHIQSGGEVEVKCGRTKLDITREVLRKCLELKKNVSKEELYEILRK